MDFKLSEYCTEFADFDLLDMIIMEMDKNILINKCLDLSKAFDTIGHKIF